MLYLCYYNRVIAKNKRMEGMSVDIVAKLRGHNLRPTKQRVALGRLLFTGYGRHVTAESLAAEARAAGLHMSLATVYNSLRQFTAANLLREIRGIGDTTWFDTNTSQHHHFYDMDGNRLVDIPASAIGICQMPPPPKGYRTEGVNVVITIASDSETKAK